MMANRPLRRGWGRGTPHFNLFNGVYNRPLQQLAAKLRSDFRKLSTSSHLKCLLFLLLYLIIGLLGLIKGVIM